MIGHHVKPTGNIDRTDRGSQMELERPAKQQIPTRSVLTRAVDTLELAVDNYSRYRPHKVPANPYFNDVAGDAGGTLQDLARRTIA